MHRSSLFRKVGIAVAIAVIAGGANRASAYSEVFFFGDSFTDTGNFFIDRPADPGAPDPALGYFDGRWQEGPAWSDYFSALFRTSAVPSLAGGNNYAIGGAFNGPFPSETPPLFFAGEEFFYLQSQVDSFVMDHPGGADPNALYAINMGSNDSRIWLRTVGDAGASAANTVSAIEQLMAEGATSFFVSPLGVLGNPALDPYRLAYDAALEALLDPLIAGGADITLFDITAYQEGFLSGDRFAELGITEFGSCLADADCAAADGGSGNFRHGFTLFDDIHLNTILHEDFANAAYRAVIPEPGTAVLLGFGCMALAARRRRVA